MHESTTSARRIKSRENEVKALELRKEGKPYSAIAAILGVSPKSAFKMVQRTLVRMSKDSTSNFETVRQLEVERLDALLGAIWPQAMGGNVDSVERALKISKRRSEIMGLDAPDKHELSGPNGAPVPIAGFRIELVEAKKQTDSSPTTSGESNEAASQGAALAPQREEK